MSRVTDAIVALAAAIEASEVECVKLEIHKGGETRNPSCEITVYPTHRMDSDASVGAYGKSSGGVAKAAVEAIKVLDSEAKAKVSAASKVAGLLVVLLACLLMLGCVGAKAETAILTNVSAFDGMVRTIEAGVVQPDGSARRLTYDELVQYVYAGRYGMRAVAFSTGVIDDEPDAATLGPPGGWIVAPVTSGSR